MAKQKIKVIREEMLQVANNVAQEKSIDKDSVFEAMEMALEKAARVKYGFERDIRVSVNRENGDINLNSYLKVVTSIDPEDQNNQIIFEDAQKINPDIKVDEFIIKKTTSCQNVGYSFSKPSDFIGQWIKEYQTISINGENIEFVWQSGAETKIKELSLESTKDEFIEWKRNEYLRPSTIKSSCNLFSAVFPIPLPPWK